MDIDFRRKRLCTVRLSRKVFPGLPSYSLGKLCNSLRIDIQDRHRAFGDAEATVELLRQMIVADQSGIIKGALKKQNREATLPPNLDREAFERVPESTGVYYFLNHKDKIIYIGKAKNIKKRLLSHFGASTKKGVAMKNDIHKVDFQVTGSELVALLLESSEIKKYWPIYNSAQLKSTPNAGIFSYFDQNGFHRLAVSKITKGTTPLVSFYNLMEARRHLEKFSKQFELCPKLCALQKSTNECFDFKIQACRGACCDQESLDTYNLRVAQCIEALGNNPDSYLILEPGPKHDQKSVILIEDGIYLGFGFVDQEMDLESWQACKEAIAPQKDNRDVQYILGLYIKKNPFIKIVQRTDFQLDTY